MYLYNYIVIKEPLFFKSCKEKNFLFFLEGTGPHKCSHLFNTDYRNMRSGGHSEKRGKTALKTVIEKYNYIVIKGARFFKFTGCFLFFTGSITDRVTSFPLCSKIGKPLRPLRISLCMQMGV